MGKEFLRTVLEQIEEIDNNLIDYRFFIDKVRYFKMKRFPYSIFFIKDVQDKKIIIAAVLGNRQDIQNIMRRRL